MYVLYSILFKTTGVHRSLGTDCIENTVSCAFSDVYVSVAADVFTGPLSSGGRLFYLLYSSFQMSCQNVVINIICFVAWLRSTGSCNQSWFLLSLHGQAGCNGNEATVTPGTVLLSFCITLTSEKLPTDHGEVSCCQ